MNDSKEKSKEYFNKTADTYHSRHDGVFVKPMYKYLLKLVVDEKPEKILDLGCGTAYLLSEIKKQIDCDACGLDISKEMLKAAKNNLEDCQYKLGDSENIPWDDDSFDLVLCSASFHHYPNPEKVLNEIRRVLKNNGILVLGDPTMPPVLRQIMNLFIKNSESGDYRIYNEKEMNDLLTMAKFKLIEYKKVETTKFVLKAQLN